MKHKVWEENEISHWRRRLVCLLLFLTSLGTGIDGQAASIKKAELLGAAPIPKDSYKSWSLFLINNPNWLVPKNNDKVKALYDAFEVFGDAIGPSHLAVWFQPAIGGGLMAVPHDRSHPQTPGDTYVDVIRCAAFCTKLNLPPGKSPYILVTTTYPGAALVTAPESFPEDLTNFSVLEFGGEDASEIVQALTNLADRLVVNGLRNTNPQSRGFWETWQKTFEAGQSTIVGFVKSFRVTIKTSWFEASIIPQ